VCVRGTQDSNLVNGNGAWGLWACFNKHDRLVRDDGIAWLSHFYKFTGWRRRQMQIPYWPQKLRFLVTETVTFKLRKFSLYPSLSPSGRHHHQWASGCQWASGGPYVPRIRHRLGWTGQFDPSGARAVAGIMMQDSEFKSWLSHHQRNPRDVVTCNAM
jgi:hypothetical protein